MQPRLRTPPGAMPDFTPVPRRHARADGWTETRQRDFIAGFAETGSVLSAAPRVGMSREGAYALRLAPGADSFRAAWATAQRGGIQRLADIAMERAIDGVAVPIHYHGEQVGERRSYNDRLLMFLMRHHDPATYGTTGISGTRSARLDAAEDRDIQAEAAEAMLRIRARLTRARRLMLCLISPDPAKRAAWEVLVGPVDWDRADQLLSQDNEPFNDDPADARPPSMRGPDMMVVAENGLLADICGGEDAMEMIRELVAEETARLREAGRPTRSPAKAMRSKPREWKPTCSKPSSTASTPTAGGWARRASGNLRQASLTERSTMPDPISPYQLRLMIAKAAAALPVAEARIHTLKQPRSLSGTYATEPGWDRTPAIDPFGEMVHPRHRPALDAPTPPFGAGEDERRVIEEWQRNLTPLSPRGIG